MNKGSVWILFHSIKSVKLNYDKYKKGGSNPALYYDLLLVIYTIPWSHMASATFRNPATFAPFT